MNSPVNMQDLKRAQNAGSANTALIQQPQQQFQLPVETAASASAAKAKALVQARYEMALHRPRDMDLVRSKMLKESARPSFAEVARYRRPQGRKKDEATGAWVENVIEGPSIRFIEMAIRCMTNILTDVTTVYDDREKRIVNVCVTDLEANVPYAVDVTVQKTIERRRLKDGDVLIRQRTNSYGDAVYLIEATDDEIVNHQNAMVSKVVRTLGQRLVAGDIVDECMEVVIETQKNKDAKDPDEAKHRIFDSFGSVGVTVDSLKDYLGHDGETLNPKELQTLRGIYAAIKEGETTWREVMDGREVKVPPAKDKEKPKQPAKQPDQASPQPAVEPKQEEAKPPAQQEAAKKDESAPRQAPLDDEFAPPSDLFISFKDRVRECKTTDDLVLVKRDIEAMENDDEKTLLLNQVATRMVALMKPAGAKPKRYVE